MDIERYKGVRIAARAVALAAICSVQAEAQVPTGAPAQGVYRCYAMTSYGGIQKLHTFALLTNSTYLFENGSRGTYSYNPSTGLLSMNSGPIQGTRQKDAPEKFSVSGQVRECDLIQLCAKFETQRRKSAELVIREAGQGRQDLPLGLSR